MWNDVISTKIISVFLSFFLKKYVFSLVSGIRDLLGHYQKIDKYKRKYRGNIFVSNFPRDFTDGNIPSVKSVGKFVGKTVNTVHHVNYKGNHRWNFPSVFSRELHNYSLSNCTFKCCSLRTKSPTDLKVVGVIWWFSEKIQLI